MYDSITITRTLWLIRYWNAWEVWYETHNERPPGFTARIITHKIIKPAEKTYVHLHSLRKKVEESKGLCVFWLTIIHATGLFRRVTDCLMVDCRALLRGSSDWVAAKHLAVSRGAPRRQSSYNREVILRKMSSSSGTSDENGGFARAMEISIATSKGAYPGRRQ